MGNLIRKAVEITAKGFDIERRILFPANSSLILLKRDGRTQVFNALRQVDKGYIVRYDGFRNLNKVEIATNDDIKEIIYQTSHFAFNRQVYAVRDGDVSPPFGDRFTWLIFGQATKDVHE
jgi:hypothetical protein